ncbi:MAG TPA: hypothetical protein VF023_02010 [Bryobacteraceae bacterium]|jgi:YD repeat-containing protein
MDRLTSVVEDPNETNPDGTSYTGLNYTTSYAYNALGDLTSVTQGAQTRSFVYDGLQRLLSSTQPELTEREHGLQVRPETWFTVFVSRG